MTTFVFVRHGQSEWNKSNRWQGQADVALSDQGRDQARLLAERLVAEGARFDHIYASDLGRALETAQTVAAALHMPVHPLIELREIHIGAWSGLTGDEIRARFPDEWATVQRGGDCRRGGDGETLAEFHARVARAVEYLARTHPDQCLLVVTHGGTIHRVLHYVEHFGVPVAHPHIDNTSLTEIILDGDVPRVVRVNDVEHLQPAVPVLDTRIV